MRNQPRILSAGSAFANPEGTFAGKLIEEATARVLQWRRPDL
jgi:UDP-N-acetylenolpyruvoylglucosamine reductase